MICLGIESTAHTFGIAVLDGKKVLSNIRDSYTTKKGGMVPADVANHHVNVCDSVLKQALAKAKVKLKNVKLVAYSEGPGIGHSLRIGVFAARCIAGRLNAPLVGVNHCIAHLEIGKLVTSDKNPVMLYASGANTQIIAYEGKKYRIFGESLDQGVGNFIDSFARYTGLGFPGGPVIERLAKKGKKFIELPYSVKGMDVSFGGMLTNLKRKYDSGNEKIEDLCYSIQETVFAMLLEVSERAMAHCGKEELLFGGGVCCNKRLQEMAKIMCKERGAKLLVPGNEFLVDNAAMIGWLGILMSGNKKNLKKLETASIKPYERTDEVEVNW